MSATPWNHEPIATTGGPTARRHPAEQITKPDRSVAHYREALWAARIALLASILAAGFAFLGAIVSLISLCYSLR